MKFSDIKSLRLLYSLSHFHLFSSTPVVTYFLISQSTPFPPHLAMSHLLALFLLCSVMGTLFHRRVDPGEWIFIDSFINACLEPETYACLGLLARVNCFIYGSGAE